MKLLTATGIVTQVLRTFFETKFQGKCFKTIKTELFRAFQILQNAHLNIFYFIVAFVREFIRRPSGINFALLYI